MKGKIVIYCSFLIFFLLLTPVKVNAVDNMNDLRLDIYHEFSVETGIPWYLIAAIDQYERNTKSFREYCPKTDEVISVCIPPILWSGVNNPVIDDRNLWRIELFQGIGRDYDGDGYADRLNMYDRLHTFLWIISQKGITEDSIYVCLRDYYNSEKGVRIIQTIARLFNHFNTLDLGKRVHPIPKGYNASIISNYGAGRSFGGPRVHEGVDIFADYGTPVVATAYGVVEVKGWNRLGGYRIGIRDIYNTYEFYAHLSSYALGIEEGAIVKPGQIIGYVGSTGYGKEGTSGKFPPHLHFGLYKFDGKKEWSFNPYPYLVKWEKERLH